MGKKQKTNGGDAVIYARYSSHNQRDVSIEQQVEACRKHAAELGLTVTATYEDRAISGKTDKRPSFQRMMRDAEQHKFAYVLAWKSNRIGRNMMQALVNESRLVDCGVKVFYAEEDFDDNAAGRFALRSMMNVNQFYIENMAEDVKRGLYDNAKRDLSMAVFRLAISVVPTASPKLTNRKRPLSGRFIHESPPGSFLPA